MNQEKNHLRNLLKNQNFMYKSFKKIFDFVFALFFIVLLSPLVIPIMLILLFTGEGEIFYLQVRIGLNNNSFKIIKFATMLKNSPNIGAGDITIKNDNRVLKFGKFLRITKLNELPQIINVLNGSMSFVGARPLMKSSFDIYSEEIKKSIYKTSPGITGIASLIFRDEENIIFESNTNPRDYYEKYILPYKGELELWYQERISFITDLKILVLTVVLLFAPKYTKLIFYCFRDLPINKYFYK